MPLPDHIWCFLVGGGEAFRIDIDESRTWTMLALKDDIKVKMAPALDTVAAHALVLYRVEIDKSYDTEKRTDEFERSPEDLKYTKLDNFEELLEIFGKSPLPGKIDVILVRTPEDEQADASFPPPGELRLDAAQLETLTTLIRKRKMRDDDDDDAGTGPSKKPKMESEPVERDILSDVSEDEYDETEDNSAGSDILSNEPILEEMERAGYTIPPPLPEGWESLLPLTAKTLVVDSQHGKSVIVKLTDKHEVEVLRRLHANQSTKPTRIIPLMDVLDGRLMVLPLRTPLRHFLVFDIRGDDIEQLALQFLEGVAYLQQSSIAHLDLKPDNIVVRRDPQSKKVDLSIIDFNIAVYADTEPTISGETGTRGWRAPEVTARKPYDPLLADRWSCGRVLEYLTEQRMVQNQMRERMRLLSRRLMDPDPSRRPPVDLHQLDPQKMEGAPDLSI